MVLMRATSVTRASGRRLSAGNRDFFGPCEVSSSRIGEFHLGPKKDGCMQRRRSDNILVKKRREALLTLSLIELINTEAHSTQAHSGTKTHQSQSGSDVLE
jgi:hypothetical protein